MNYDILDHIDSAFVAYLAAGDIADIPPENVFPGNFKEGDDQKAPNIVIDAQDGGEEILGSGNFVAQVSITVASQADDTTRESHIARCDAVFKLLMDTEVTGAVSAALDGFTLFQVRGFRHSKQRQGRQWQNTLTIEVECAAGDVV